MRPNISVVIPTFNGLSLLKKHLPDVLAVLQKDDEVIVVEDAGTDETPAWCETQNTKLASEKISIRCVKHEKNQRFAAAVNTGVAHASHNYVFLLNNDVSPLDQKSVQLLLRWFVDPKMFAVGCAEVQNRKADAHVSGRGTGGWQRGLAVHWYDPNQSLSNTLWTSGGSMFFDKKKFIELGGFDTLYTPAYEEDRDLSYRALKHGWKVAFDPEVIVHHQHESTNKDVFGQRLMADVSWKNQYLFVWKNITDRNLLISHLLWLPYHLLISGQRSEGSSVRGFVRALHQLPQAIFHRRAVSKLWTKTDHAVFALASTPMESPFSTRS
jgi:GT2 family glycosyltransferase